MIRKVFYVNNISHIIISWQDAASAGSSRNEQQDMRAEHVAGDAAASFESVAGN